MRMTLAVPAALAAALGVGFAASCQSSPPPAAAAAASAPGAAASPAAPAPPVTVTPAAGAPSTETSPPAMEAAGAGDAFFKSKVQPLLSSTCVKCHGPQRPKGGLRLDSRAALLKGGEHGPAVVPGHPEKSLVIKAVSWKDGDLKMPPMKKLPDQQIADLTKWVKVGAPWPGSK